jgi:hypothetical protein
MGLFMSRRNRNGFAWSKRDDEMTAMTSDAAASQKAAGTLASALFF